ncbi:MAG: hypothetical protein Athens101428_649, partial [Candidatus Berkelbacteria bacterium Athens1014_28]
LVERSSRSGLTKCGDSPGYGLVPSFRLGDAVGETGESWAVYQSLLKKIIVAENRPKLAVFCWICIKIKLK